MAVLASTSRVNGDGAQQRDAIEGLLEGVTLAFMLYGSQARGDARANSDIDVLQVVAHGARSYSHGAINVSAYTVAHLQDLARRGSLFIRHLRNEGLTLSDPSGALNQVLSDYRAPTSYAAMRNELAVVISALELPGATRFEPAASRAAAFALRSLLYAACAEAGIDEFDVVRAAERIGRPEVGTELRSSQRHLGRLVQHARWFLHEAGTNPLPALAPDFDSAVIWTGAAHPAAGALLEAVLVGDAQIDYTSLTLPIA